MPHFPIVLFDLDHTLLDSDSSERLAYASTMAAAGLEEPEAHFATYREINGRLWAAVERRELTPNDVKRRRFDEFCATVDLDADTEAMGVAFTDGLADHGELYPGARELLDAAGASATLGLVTNGIGSVQRRRLTRLGLDADFAAVAVSGELGVAKPDPAIFERVFADLSDALGRTVGPDETVMIGDSLSSDIRGAADAGITAIWFNRHGAQAPADLTIAHEVHDLAEIAPLL